jgi:glycosyltransferase involved in cell wall biosynthesis
MNQRHRTSRAISTRDSIHVVVLNDYGFPAGGNSRVAITQAEGLARLGNVVTFVTAMGSAAAPDVRPALDGIHRTVVTGQWDLVTNPSSARAFLQGLWNPRMAEALRGALLDLPLKRAVLLVNSFSKACSASFLPMARRLGVPVVVVAHDYFMWCPNGAWHNYRTGTPCSLIPMSTSCVATHCDKRSYAQKVWRVARQTGYRLAGLPHRVDGLIFGSEFSRDLAASMGVLPTRHWILPLPLPENREVVDTAANTRFVFVGRLDADKGALVLAEAARVVGAEVTFVGEGEERARIEALLPSARVTGWLAAGQVALELASARALVVPTVLRESFGLTVYEAASMGVPSIVSEGSAPAQFISHDENGLLFEMGSVSSLAKQLSRVIEDPRLSTRLGASAHSRFRQLRSSESEYCTKLAQVLHEIVDSKSTSNGGRG